MVATVLVADDNAPFRRVICDMLNSSHGFRVVGEAPDGITATRLAEELKPSIVLLDLSMPWMNGFDAARSIARNSPTSRIIFVTGYAGLDVARTAFEIGARGYVLKVHLEELLTALEAVMREDIFVSRALKSRLEDER